MSQTTVAATAKAKTQAIYVPTAVGRLRVALTCDDNYPAEDGLGAASIRDIVEQRTFRVHERAGAGSTCTLIGYGSSSRLPLSTATRHTQNRKDYQCLRIIPSSPPHYVLCDVMEGILHHSWRRYSTDCESASNTFAENALHPLRKAVSTRQPGSFSRAGIGGGEGPLRRLNCLARGRRSPLWGRVAREPGRFSPSSPGRDFPLPDILAPCVLSRCFLSLSRW
jgi:hypothetical protein